MRALDLFCKAGGATRGLQQAGYEVTGVDIEPQPRYVGERFFCDDAMAWLRGEREPLAGFDLIWASPPCQRYSKCTPMAHKDKHPDLLPEVLDILRAQPLPYIVENVHGTQHLMRNPIFLCGSMFGLNFWRHRWFEVGNVADFFFLLPPCKHAGTPVLISGTHRVKGRRWDDTHATKSQAIEIDWMVTTELDEAIPPAYSRFLAEHMKAVLL